MTLAAALLMIVAPSTTPDVELWGHRADGRAVHLYRMTNARGMQVALSDHGAAIVDMRVQDAGGNMVNIVVSPGSFAGFERSARRFGAIVGRYAGRLSGSVTINGHRYPLATNALGVTLHGGDPGFDRALWTARPLVTRRASGVAFTYHSAHGEQGFPGTLAVTARYLLARDRNELTLQIVATTDRPTVINLTNHVYFNLAGGGTVGSHCLTVPADRILALDDRKLPNGRFDAVAGTAFDFRTRRALGPLIAGGGMDTLFAYPTHGVTLADPKSGLRLKVTSDAPGVQLFTGNAFDGSDRDAFGQAIPRHAGIAIEPQAFPDSPNIAAFPTTHVTPEKPYRRWMRWRIGNGAGNCR